MEYPPWLSIQPTNPNITPVHDLDFRPNATIEQRGAHSFDSRCAVCHVSDTSAGAGAPDLRASPFILSQSEFLEVIRGGLFLERGMPSFDNLSNTEVESIRQYLRSRAKILTTNGSARKH